MIFVFCYVVILFFIDPTYTFTKSTKFIDSNQTVSTFKSLLLSIFRISKFNLFANIIFTLIDLESKDNRAQLIKTNLISIFLPFFVDVRKNFSFKNRLIITFFTFITVIFFGIFTIRIPFLAIFLGLRMISKSITMILTATMLDGGNIQKEIQSPIKSNFIIHNESDSQDMNIQYEISKNNLTHWKEENNVVVDGYTIKQNEVDFYELTGYYKNVSEQNVDYSGKIDDLAYFSNQTTPYSEYSSKLTDKYLGNTNEKIDNFNIEGTETKDSICNSYQNSVSYFSLTYTELFFLFVFILILIFFNIFILLCSIGWIFLIAHESLRNCMTKCSVHKKISKFFYHTYDYIKYNIFYDHTSHINRVAHLDDFLVKIYYKYLSYELNHEIEKIQDGLNYKNKEQYSTKNDFYDIQHDNIDNIFTSESGDIEEYIFDRTNKHRKMKMIFFVEKNYVNSLQMDRIRKVVNFFKIKNIVELVYNDKTYIHI